MLPLGFLSTPHLSLQSKFLRESLIETVSESEIKEHAHELIEELNRVSPSLIAEVLPDLELELKVRLFELLMDIYLLFVQVEDDKTRLAAVDLLVKLFATKNVNLAAQQKVHGLWRRRCGWLMHAGTLP